MAKSIKQLTEEAAEMEKIAKQKRREINEFWKIVDQEKEAILERFASDNLLKKASDIYGVSERELFDYITSEKQVEYFKRYHSTQSDSFGYDTQTIY